MTRKLVSVETVKLSDQIAGYEFCGKFIGIVQGEKWIDKTTGEEKHILSLILEDSSGRRTAYVADKGLLGQLQVAQIKSGDWISVLKKEKIKLTKGRTMNDYDIYLDDPPAPPEPPEPPEPPAMSEEKTPNLFDKA